MKKAMNTNAADWENTYYQAGGAPAFYYWASRRIRLENISGKRLRK